MFDDELAPGECELLARRLSRDEQLKARWGRYAVSGRPSAPRWRAAQRAAGRPRQRRSSWPSRRSPRRTARGAPGCAGGSRGGGRGRRGVAAVSVLWLRAQTPLPGLPLNAHLTARQRTVPGAAVVAAAAAGAPDSYVVPRAPAVRAPVVPSTELANYVVAHSVFSSPVTRRNLLSAFMTGESGSAAEEPRDDAQSNVR